MLSYDGWSDCLPLLAAEAKKLKPWAMLCDASVKSDEGLSSPEAMDPKTDSGCLPMAPLPELIKTKQILDLATATESDLVDAMDVLLSYETSVIEGTPLLSSLFTFVYFYDLSLLEANKAFRAFARSILKHVHLLIQTVASADVRDGEEEFSLFTFELDPLFSVPVEDIIADLKTEAEACTSEAIKRRLVYRRDYLIAVKAMSDLPANNDAAAMTAAVAAVEAASASIAQLTRTSEVVASPQVFYEGAPLWLPVGSPLAKCAVPNFAYFTSRTASMLKDFQSILSWKPLANMPAVLEAVKLFGASRPNLYARSFAMLFLFEERSGSVFGGPPVHEYLLKTISTCYGAPLYERIFSRDATAVDEVVQYRASQLEKVGRGVTPATLAQFRAQTVDVVSKWTMDLSRLIVAVFHAHLHTRGRAHRRLLGILSPLGLIQGQSWEIDTLFFGRGHVLHRDAPEVAKELLGKCAVLTAVVNDIVCDVLDSVINLVIELDLLTKPELLATLFLRNYVTSSRSDNYNSLIVTSVLPPSKKAGKQGPLPPAVTTRLIAPPVSSIGARLDIARSMANASYMLLAAIGEHIPSLQPFPAAMQTTETVFHNRFAVFGQVHRPQFVSYREATKQVAQFAHDPQSSLQQAAEIYKMAVTRLRAMLADDSIIDKSFFVAAEKTCRGNLVVIHLLETALASKTLANYTIDVGSAHSPAFVTVTVKLRPAAAATA